MRLLIAIAVKPPQAVHSRTGGGGFHADVSGMIICLTEIRKMDNPLTIHFSQTIRCRQSPMRSETEPSEAE
jgi:hypothetical protein